jgi:hypothetical protein
MALAIAKEPVIIAKGIIFSSSSFVSLHYWVIKQNKTNPLTHFWYFVFVFAMGRMDVSLWKIGIFFYCFVVMTWNLNLALWWCLFCVREGMGAFHLFFCYCNTKLSLFFWCETRGIGARRRRSSNFSFVFCCYDTKQDMGT